MARIGVAMFAATLLCALLMGSVECENPGTIVVDTPSKFEQLKSGVYDNLYRFVHITSAATADVLLQPQHFASSTFQGFTFISAHEDGDNKISMYPSSRRAEVYYRSGENPLSGVPKHYTAYDVFFTYPAVPTVENVDSILSWANAYQLRISDQEDVAVQLTERSSELRGLASLSELHVTMQDDTYEKISVAAFIENLPALYEVNFSGRHMTDDQMKDFEARNRVPNGWKGWRINKLVYYRKNNADA